MEQDKAPFQTVPVGPFRLGKGCPLALIAGPCVIENEGLILETAEAIKEITRSFNIPYIFKSSYDKANRSSFHSFRGPGIEKGLLVLEKVKEKLGLPVLSDVHQLEELDAAAKVLDIIQIPAFLCRQTDLLYGAAKTQKVVNVKKGQFLAPWDVKNIIGKLEEGGNQNILLTERGSSFGYNNLVSDMRSLPIMRKFGYPVVFDATHSVQLPGGAGASSAGQREFIPPLARAAVAVGCDALFMEVHPLPEKALSDGPNMVKLKDLPELLKQVVQIRTALDSQG